MKESRLCAGLIFVTATMAQALTGTVNASEPIKLTAYEMDTVSAGTLIVDVTAIATAPGGDEFTDTFTNVDIFTKDNAEIAIVEGYALACCGRHSDTEVTLNVIADGDIVRIRPKKAISRDTKNSSLEHRTWMVVSIDLPEGVNPRAKRSRFSNHHPRKWDRKMRNRRFR